MIYEDGTVSKAKFCYFWVCLGFFVKTIIPGRSWLLLPCLTLPQQHNNVLDRPWVSVEMAVDLSTPSVLEIICSILHDCHQAMRLKGYVMRSISPLYPWGRLFTRQWESRPKPAERIRACREPDEGDFPSEKNLGKRKVPQIELDSDYSERK